jgi:hypothetical protein
MPNRFENGGFPSEALEAEGPARKLLSREDVTKILEQGGELEDVSLLDRDLSGLKLDGKSFCRSDARGLKLCREIEDGKYEMAEIRNTDWIDADIADLSSPACRTRHQRCGSTSNFSG